MSPSSRRTEVLWLIGVLLAGLLPRIVLIVFFPTRPISDFGGLVDFAVTMRDGGVTAGGWHWVFFSPGLSTLLSVVLHIVPGSPADVARWTTAILIGLLPVFPFLIWRGVFGLRVRVLVALLLALWPGQILFSGVVAQDNWALVPTLALATLAVRSMVLKDGGHPFWSAILLALATFIRQEMLVALLPVALVATGLGYGARRLVRRLLCWAATTVLLLLAIAGQRGLSTGRFALTTEHGGMAVLGAYVPGASANYWTDPLPFVASVKPSLLANQETLRKEALHLALTEASRRPGFHLARIISSALTCLGELDARNYYWSMGSPEVLPDELRGAAVRFGQALNSVFTGWPVLIHCLALAALFLGIARRHWPILMLAATALLKTGIHAVLVIQARYLLAVMVLEILMIGIGLAVWLKEKPKLSKILVLAGAAAGTTWLLAFTNSVLTNYVSTHDDVAQRTYRFVLNSPSGDGHLSCAIERGRLSVLNDQQATLDLIAAEPSAGETAAATCRLSGFNPPVPLNLRVSETYEPGDLPGRIVHRVSIDRQEVLRHDIGAEAGASWSDLPLGIVGPDTDKLIEIEIVAEKPDPGAAWGLAAGVTFELFLDEINGTPRCDPLTSWTDSH